MMSAFGGWLELRFRWWQLLTGTSLWLKRGCPSWLSRRTTQRTVKAELPRVHPGPPQSDSSWGGWGICTCYQTSLGGYHAELTGDSFNPALCPQKGTFTDRTWCVLLPSGCRVGGSSHEEAPGGYQDVGGDWSAVFVPQFPSDQATGGPRLLPLPKAPAQKAALSPHALSPGSVVAPSLTPSAFFLLKCAVSFLQGPWLASICEVGLHTHINTHRGCGIKGATMGSFLGHLPRGPHQALYPTAWSQRMTVDKVFLGSSWQWRPRYDLSYFVQSKKKNPNTIFWSIDLLHDEPDFKNHIKTKPIPFLGFHVPIIERPICSRELHSLTPCNLESLGNGWKK